MIRESLFLSHTAPCCTVFIYPLNTPIILALQAWNSSTWCVYAAFQSLAWIHTSIALVAFRGIPGFRCGFQHDRKKSLGPTLNFHAGLITSSLHQIVQKQCGSHFQLCISVHWPIWYRQASSVSLLEGLWHQLLRWQFELLGHPLAKRWTEPREAQCQGFNFLSGLTNSYFTNSRGLEKPLMVTESRGARNWNHVAWISSLSYPG